MPLSEHEQRMLEQIERALYADDPKLASTVRAINPRTHYLRRLAFNGAMLVLGLAVLLIGVVLNRGVITVVIGVAGFALAFLSASRAIADLRRLGSHAAPLQRGKRTTRKPLAQRLEERWRRRHEDFD